jgi:hypothetical protein
MSEDLKVRERDDNGTALQRAPQPTLMEVLQTVAARGGNANELEIIAKLVMVAEDRERERQFSASFNECQKEMPRVIKSEQNSQTGSWYSPLEAVQLTCMPIATKHGFACSFTEADCPKPNHKRTVLEISHSCGFKLVRQIDLPIDGVGGKGNAIGAMNPVQAEVSTMSYGQRKVFCLAWNIACAGEDMDGQTPGHAGTLDTEELKVIHDLFERNTQTKVAVTLQSFLDWVNKLPGLSAKVEDIESIPRALFKQVKTMLEARLKAKGGK